MWRLEKDPYLSSTFGTVSVLDRPPDFDRLRARMERATWNVPRLRWRVQPAPVNLSAPMWADDPEFDIDVHVRRIALPSPGSMRQLLDLGDVDHARPVRPDATAVAVHRRRGAARRQGGAGVEDAPHDHRRRGRHADVAAVPRLRSRRARSAGRRARVRRADRCRPRRLRPRPSAIWSPAASGSRSVSPARSWSCSPTRWRSRPRARQPSARSAVSWRSSPTSRRRTRRCGRSARCIAGWRSCGRRSGRRSPPPRGSAAR